LDDHDIGILKEYDVIGMTVSGAATRLHLLGKSKQKIVLGLRCDFPIYILYCTK
jgi:hypothetical protein